MIHFVTPAAGVFGLFNYIEDHDPALGERIVSMTYEALGERVAVPAGSYVFTALDQLTPGELEMVSELRAALARAVPGAALLNDPARVLLRAELLDALHADGANEFRAVRASREPAGVRYPVFVREANQHTGSLTPLLADRRQLDRALLRLRFKGYPAEDLLVVEYCDTADENGLYAKYSAFVVGRAVVPRSLTFSAEWVTKQGVMVKDEALIAREYEYVERNPHEAWLAGVFERAGVEYGRIDYGFRDGRPQVWEINLNATVARGPRKGPRTPEQDRARAARRPAREIFKARFREAWARIDCAASGTVDWRAGAELRGRIAAERRARERVRRRIDSRERLFQLAPIRALVSAIRTRVF